MKRLFLCLSLIMISASAVQAQTSDEAAYARGFADGFKAASSSAQSAQPAPAKFLVSIACTCEPITEAVGNVQKVVTYSDGTTQVSLYKANVAMPSYKLNPVADDCVTAAAKCQ